MPGSAFPSALGILELSSVARGFVVADAMVKRAPVQLLGARPISSGKYLIMVGGGVAEVEEALQAGRFAAGIWLVDELALPQAHARLWPALIGRRDPIRLFALGIVETKTVVSTVLAADAAAKIADIHFAEMRLGRGIGGKAFFVLTGSLDEVEASVGAAIAAAGDRLIATEIIAAPHEDFTRKFDL